MKKIIDWFKSSNRWKHLLGGILVGALANDWYCAIYAGVVVGASMEYKDFAWGGKCDWIDFGLTALGAVLGRLTREAVLWVR